MEQDVQFQDTVKKQMRNVEFVKVQIDEIYKNGQFYSLSLHTLELTRRFNEKYQKFSEEPQEENFRELLILTERLEEKLYTSELLN